MIELANIGIFALVAVVFASLTLSVAWLIRPSVAQTDKDSAYECGMPSEGSTEIRTHIRFYTIALFFVLFDVETLYLYPWAIRARETGLGGLAAIGIFISVLFLGLIYAWKKGALEWE